MNLTKYVTTRWYRAPELLLQWDTYNKSMDIWSIGCIFAELIDKKTLFQGKETSEQIELILSILGTPKIEDIYKEGRSNSREIIYKFGKIPKIPFKEIFKSASDEALDLLEKMLKFDPDKRISIEDALNHKYFDDIPKEEEENVVEQISKFDFEFEELDLNISELRDLILHEIMLYHDQTILEEYEKAKQLYIKGGDKKKEKVSMIKSGSKQRTNSKSSKSKI